MLLVSCPLLTYDLLPYYLVVRSSFFTPPSWFSNRQILGLAVFLAKEFSPGQSVPPSPATFLLFKCLWAVLKSCSKFKSGPSSPIPLTAAQSWLLVLIFLNPLQERAPNLLRCVSCFCNQPPSMPQTSAVMVAKLLITFFFPPIGYIYRTPYSVECIFVQRHISWDEPFIIGSGANFQSHADRSINPQFLISGKKNNLNSRHGNDIITRWMLIYNLQRLCPASHRLQPCETFQRCLIIDNGCRYNIYRPTAEHRCCFQCFGQNSYLTIWPPSRSSTEWSYHMTKDVNVWDSFI